MNRVQLLIVIFSTSATVFGADPPGGYYVTRYDFVDVEAVLNNKRLVNHYSNCLLNRGPCPPQATELKRILPEALQTGCLRCTEKHKEIAIQTVKRLRSEYPIIWSELVSFYDPDGAYFINFIRSLDPTIEIEDQSNLLSNRFGDDDFPNNLDMMTTKKTTQRPTTTRRSTRPTTRPTTRTSTPSMNRTAEDSMLNLLTPSPDLMLSNRFSPDNATNSSSNTQRTIFNTTVTTAKPSSPTNGNEPITFGWRPVVFGQRPQITRPQNPFVQGNINLLTSIGEIGSRVIQAGTQVAGVVLSSVQAMVGCD
ncbi:hypothetical protein FQA39_LY10786 [Lamprigera yunnana]|nr:hypothetical protein FQA39_LY10786 [Lamprigera yunnana]